MSKEAVLSDSLLIPCCMIQLLLRQAWAAAPQKLLASSLPRNRRRLPARATGPADQPESQNQACKREHETCELYQVLAVRLAAKQCTWDKLQRQQRKECRTTGCIYKQFFLNGLATRQMNLSQSLCHAFPDVSSYTQSSLNSAIMRPTGSTCMRSKMPEWHFSGASEQIGSASSSLR